MTPEAWTTLVGFVNQYGLPLTILGVFVFLILRGKLVTGRELEKMTSLFERERTDRIAAEAIVAKFANANADVAEAVASLSQTVLDRDTVKHKNPYIERERG